MEALPANITAISVPTPVPAVPVHGPVPDTMQAHAAAMPVEVPAPAATKPAARPLLSENADFEEGEVADARTVQVTVDGELAVLATVSRRPGPYRRLPPRRERR